MREACQQSPLLSVLAAGMDEAAERIEAHVMAHVRRELAPLYRRLELTERALLGTIDDAIDQQIGDVTGQESEAAS